jgi:mercuric ion transport protein
METKPRKWSWLLLFTTSATLVCCAIPIALVTLGMGAAVASLASSAPWLIALSMHKGWVFAISGALIAAAIWAIFRPGRTCPADPELAAACAAADTWNKRFLWVSAVLWIIGFVAAFFLEYAMAD